MLLNLENLVRTDNNRPPLLFSSTNAKVEKALVPVAIFNLPSGWTCPGALECLSRADPQNRTITDGPQARYRCFMATLEAARPAVMAAAWRNLRLLRGPWGGSRESMARMLWEDLPVGVQVVRIHGGGDFFNQDYFDAWCDVAARVPDARFYAYTKSLPLWVRRKDAIPPNLRLTASRGGRYDALIDDHELRSATVVFSPEEAAALSLEVDKDDSHARGDGGSFALMLHGVQPSGTPAAEALKALRRNTPPIEEQGLYDTEVAEQQPDGNDKTDL